MKVDNYALDKKIWGNRYISRQFRFLELIRPSLFLSDTCIRPVEGNQYPRLKPDESPTRTKIITYVLMRSKLGKTLARKDQLEH